MRLGRVSSVEILMIAAHQQFPLEPIGVAL